MTQDQILLVILATICLAGSVFAITRRDPRPAVAGIAVVLFSIVALSLGAARDIAGVVRPVADAGVGVRPTDPLDIVALELVGRLGPGSAALFMLVIVGLVIALAPRIAGDPE